MRRDSGAERVQQLRPQRHYRDGKPDGHCGHCGTSADVYRDGRWKHDHNGFDMDLPILVYPAADFDDSEPESDHGNLHQRFDAERRLGRDLGDHHHQRFKRPDLYRASPLEFPEPGADPYVHSRSGCKQEQDRNNDSNTGLRYSSHGDPSDGNSSGWLDARPANFAKCVVSQFTGHRPAVEIGSTKFQFEQYK